MLLAWIGRSPSAAWAAPTKAKTDVALNAAAKSVVGIDMEISFGVGGRPEAGRSLAAGNSGGMIIDQTDWVDNGYRYHQSRPRGPQPPRPPRCVAERAQRHARRGSRRHRSVGNEPQSRAPTRPL